MIKKEGYSVKHEIIEAFLELMKEKSYMDITVTDIITKAQVARASFYRNFNSISDIIDIITDELCETFIEDIYPTLSSTDERKWREFLFNYFYRFTSHNRQMLKFNTQNISVMFSRIDTRIKLKGMSFPKETMKDKYAVTGKLGLINSITKKWLNDGMNETPEEMVNYIMSFIVKF